MTRFGLGSVVLCALPFAACNPPDAAASILVDISGTGNVRGFASPAAELLVLDKEQRAVRVNTVDDLGESYSVQTPMAVPCSGVACDARVSLPAGEYSFHLTLTAADRCGERATVVRLSSSARSFAPNEAADVVLSQADWSFDDDNDGIENALEPAVCGRFFVGDEERPATECEDPLDACCAPTSALIGRATRFAGGAHTLPGGSSVTVDAFHLDATEVTWNQLSRCVAAGACLPRASGEDEHPARVHLREPGLDLSLPATGLTPDEADSYCAWRGKRLPTDAEWDFAAAHRDDGSRGRWPWDTAALGAVLDDGSSDQHAPPSPPPLGCLPGEALAANHRAPGRGCPREPQPVGSYDGTFVHRGVGVPLADMGGNAWEWTHDDGTDTWVLRGGGWDSVPELLENNLRLVLATPDDVARLRDVAGFRCLRPLAADEDAAVVDAELTPKAEPACVPDRENSDVEP